MTMTDHCKTYEPIAYAIAFGALDNGPSLVRIDVVANTSPDQNYPDYRIIIGTRVNGTVSLTLKQSAQLRALLERAERDVRAGIGTDARIATGAEGRCESCSRPIAAGEAILVETDAILHAGPCGGEERADG